MHAHAQTLSVPQADRKYFTVDQANAALGYVSRVVGDLCAAYHRAVRLQRRMEFPMPEPESDALRVEYDRIIDQLNRYVDELGEVGVALKDYEVGLVDFPAVHEGREVYLCWKLGEGRIEAWHEVDAGFAGRRKVEELGGE